LDGRQDAGHFVHRRHREARRIWRHVLAGVREHGAASLAPVGANGWNRKVFLSTEASAEDTACRAPTPRFFLGTPLHGKSSHGQLAGESRLLSRPRYVVVEAEANYRRTNRRFEVTNWPRPLLLPGTAACTCSRPDRRSPSRGSLS